MQPRASYFQVAVPLPVDKLFTYTAPPSMIDKVRIGKRVRAPFGRRKLVGYIVGLLNEADIPPAGIKEVLEVIDDEPVITAELLKLSQWMAGHYICPWGMALKAMLPATGFRPPKSPKPPPGKTAPAISPDPSTFNSPILLPQTLREAFAESLTSRSHLLPYLLYAPAKYRWEAYLQIIAQAVDADLQALVLLPELPLVLQFWERCTARFGSKAALLHGELSPTMRYREWQQILQGKAAIAVGTRCAVFAPLSRPGVIIIDDEHHKAYKEGQTPKYHAREVGLARAELAGVPLILGSATPSIESFYKAKEGEYQLCEVDAPRQVSPRAQSSPQVCGQEYQIHAGYGFEEYKSEIKLPEIKLVDMRSDQGAHGTGSKSPGPEAPKRQGGHPKAQTGGHLSVTLLQAIEKRLDKGKTSLLIIQRRGYASLVICSECKDMLNCPRCSLSLTYHRQNTGKEYSPHSQTSEEQAEQYGRLRCHSCGYSIPLPPSCPTCRKGKFHFFGPGTQWIEDEAMAAFPEARIARLDRDLTRQKKYLANILDKLQQGEIDLLVSTQMATYRLDWRRITLVGLINADLAFSLPDFRAAERGFQFLGHLAEAMVGGGRASNGAGGAVIEHCKHNSSSTEDHREIILQTHNPEHYPLVCAQSLDYPAFFQRELKFRQELDYPPFTSVASLWFKGKNGKNVAAGARWLAKKLKQVAEDDVRIAGPSPAVITKVNREYRWQMMLKGPTVQAVVSCAKEGSHLWSGYQKSKSIRLEIDIDPVEFL